MNKKNLQDLAICLKKGGIAVIPTDTIYGIVGSALNPDTVGKIYNLRQRAGSKPLIILISSLKDLEKFHIKLPLRQKRFLTKIWPNPVSVILPCKNDDLEHLHRGTNSLAFRIPNLPWLLDLLKHTGPLVAPSANPEGKIPAKNITEARNYFTDRVDIYVDTGSKIKSASSAVIRLKGDKIEVLREGIFSVPATF